MVQFTPTLDPIDGMSLQGIVRELEYFPQVWRYLAEFECRAIDELVYVVE
jgi:hypothetical protein